MKNIENSKLTDVKGFTASAVHCGLKSKGKLDLMILKSDKPCICSAVFTTNKVKAAPVLIGIENLDKTGGIVEALIVNSGNANAVTGTQGMNDVYDILEYLGNKLDIEKEKILMSSTGIIGKNIDVSKVKQGIDDICKDLNKENGALCSHAILTTDTVEKTKAVIIDIEGTEICISGITKGAGMIAPNMATMLAFVTTDADIDKDLLDEIFKECVETSFNSITVDGDMSTNDTCFILANGVAENEKIIKGGKGENIFKNALKEVMLELAKSIVKDGEGATKFIKVTTQGAEIEKDAKTICFAIANSNLVKTAMFGCDANWGRILSSAGSAGVDFELNKVDLYINDIMVLENGAKLVEKQELNDVIKQENIEILIDIKQGEKSSVVYTSDFSYDYVKINAEYHT
jgi:glutamate N-acetyltransferase / amino-acid N-acetyltransferase